MTPRFSIAIPVLNRPHYLQRALESCLAQTVSDFEIVVSDNCSTDDLETVAASFDDSRVRYDRSGSRLGAAQNHQRAVLLSRAEYIVNFHSDDLMLPRFLEIMGAALDRTPNAAAAYAAMALLDHDRVEGWHSVPTVAFADELVFQANRWLEKHNHTVPSSCLFRRTAFDRIGGYRSELRLAYDWDLYMRFMRFGGGVLFLPNLLVVYRRHEDQASRDGAPVGLYDMLDLWSEREYAHWPAADLVDLILTQVTVSLRTRAGLGRLWRNVRDSGQLQRLLPGLAPAIARRLWRRSRGDGLNGQHYMTPCDVETSLAAARAIART